MSLGVVSIHNKSGARPTKIVVLEGSLRDIFAVALGGVCAFPVMMFDGGQTILTILEIRVLCVVSRVQLYRSDLLKLL